MSLNISVAGAFLFPEDKVKPLYIGPRDHYKSPINTLDTLSVDNHFLFESHLSNYGKNLKLYKKLFGVRVY